MKSYKLVVAGGTFDHFHRGHREFLRFILSLSEVVLLGISSNKFIKNKKGNIEDCDTRKKSVLDFLSGEKALQRVTIQSIDSVHIPSQWENLPTEAIISTEETKRGAEKINQNRKEKRLLELPVEIFPFVLAEDNAPISSQRIRNGEINHEGRAWIHPDWTFDTLFLPPSLRDELKKPFGRLYKNETEIPRIDGMQTITVGDVVTKSFNDLHYKQHISVFDFVVQREKKFQNLEELGFKGNETLISLVNPAGVITPELTKSVLEIFTRMQDKRVILRIDGEEDLAVLPFLLRAPLGFTIYYGQPNEGIVAVKVTEEAKNKAYSLIQLFKTSTRGH